MKAKGNRLGHDASARQHPRTNLSEQAPAPQPPAQVRVASSGAERDAVAWIVIGVEIFAAVAAAVSAYAAYLAADAAREQTHLSRRAPIEAAVFEAKWAAYQTYLDAAVSFRNIEQLALNRIPNRDGVPVFLNSSDITELQATKNAVSQVMPAYGQFNATLNRVAPIWPNDIKLKISAAGAAGLKLSQCFMALSPTPLRMSPEDWEQTRTKAIRTCAPIMQGDTAGAEFDETVKDASHAMNEHLQEVAARSSD